MRDVFVSQIQLIQRAQPEALSLFCQGYITFGQALKFTTARHRFGGMRLFDLKVNKQNKRHRNMILSRLRYIVPFPPATIRGILDELDTTPPEIAEDVMLGRLTLLESRAIRNIREFTIDDLRNFRLRNYANATFVTPKNKRPAPSRDCLTFRRAPVLRFGTR